MAKKISGNAGSHASCLRVEPPAIDREVVADISACQRDRQNRRLTLNPAEYRNWFYGAASPGKVFWNQVIGMLLLMFIGLQLMDGVTTIWFLRHGVAEGNPLIRAALGLTAAPAAGLAISKIAAVTIAALAWRSGRQRLLWVVNAVFAACVLWNLAATALA